MANLRLNALLSLVLWWASSNAYGQPTHQFRWSDELQEHVATYHSLLHLFQRPDDYTDDEIDPTGHDRFRRASIRIETHLGFMETYLETLLSPNSEPYALIRALHLFNPKHLHYYGYLKNNQSDASVALRSHLRQNANENYAEFLIRTFLAHDNDRVVDAAVRSLLGNAPDSAELQNVSDILKLYSGELDPGHLEASVLGALDNSYIRDRTYLSIHRRFLALLEKSYASLSSDAKTRVADYIVTSASQWLLSKSPFLPGSKRSDAIKALSVIISDIRARDMLLSHLDSPLLRSSNGIGLVRAEIQAVLAALALATVSDTRVLDLIVQPPGNLNHSDAEPAAQIMIENLAREMDTGPLPDTVALAFLPLLHTQRANDQFLRATAVAARRHSGLRLALWRRAAGLDAPILEILSSAGTLRRWTETAQRVLHIAYGGETTANIVANAPWYPAQLESFTENQTAGYRGNALTTTYGNTREARLEAAPVQLFLLEYEHRLRVNPQTAALLTQANAYRCSAALTSQM